MLEFGCQALDFQKFAQKKKQLPKGWEVATLHSLVYET
jgi:hypothetical protein